MRDHGSPSLSLGHVVSLDSLSHAANLVDLQQQTIAGLLLNSSGDSLGVGDQQIVSHNLDAGAGGQLGITFPVILVKGILNTQNRVVTDKSCNSSIEALVLGLLLVFTLVHFKKLVR